MHSRVKAAAHLLEIHSPWDPIHSSKFRSRIAESNRLFDAASLGETPEPPTGRKNRPPVRWNGHMAEGGTFTFGDPDGYTAAFGDARINLTITGAGDFTARLTRLKLQHLEVYRCRESLPRIAYLSFPPEPIILSFPVGTASPIFGGFALRAGDMVLHAPGERVHQRSNGGCHWGLMRLSARQLANCGEALIGQPIASPHVSRVLRPRRAEALRFQRLFGHACRLAETGRKLIGRPEVARALEQELLHSLVHCLAADEADDFAKMRHHHAAIMVRFEEALTKHIDEKLNLPALCAELGVAERTLRMCCAEILGVSPTRYLLLQRLNRARAALRRANPSTASVAEVARNNQFQEFGRFAVTYRTIFGESPSITLQRDARK
jgi:AraC-like DNA-binding protein